jgi:hypothetical protein
VLIFPPFLKFPSGSIRANRDGAISPQRVFYSVEKMAFFFLTKRLKRKSDYRETGTHFKPLSLRETRRYIEYYLETVGFKGSSPLDSDAVREIHRFSQGYPRLINAICNRAFSTFLGKGVIKKQAIRAIISDMAARTPMGKAIYPEKAEKWTQLSRESRKIRLKASYIKDAKGFIKATIEVLDPGDFQTANVFESTRENPCGGTSKTLPTSDEAKEWVLSQVKTIKKKLK